MDRKPDQSPSADGPIEERLLDQGQTSQEDIVTAAQEGFEEDQQSPDHPSRRDRELADGMQDPSHSRGSTRHGAGEGDEK